MGPIATAAVRPRQAGDFPGGPVAGTIPTPMARPRTSKVRRWLDLAGLSVKVAASHAATKVAAAFDDEDEARRRWEETQRRTGRALAETLGRLKGAAMKVGQMASTARDFLPAPVAEALSALQRGAPPMPWDELRPHLEHVLGDRLASAFAFIETEPFAAASIGQVHRGRLADGAEVAIKVQYPGVGAAVASDLAMLRLSLRAGGLVQLDRGDLDRVFAEIRVRLEEELDYLREAKNLSAFGAFHAGDSDVVVPRPIEALCTRQVLVMTYEPSVPLGAFAAAGPPPSVRDRVGATLARVLGDQLFRFERIQTDPNPANYGVRPDGRVVLYDFGSVKEVPRPFLDAYRDAVAGGLSRDMEALEQALLRMGARRPHRPPPDPPFYETWCRILAEPFEAPGPYDFGATDLHVRVAELLPDFLSRHVAAFTPPPDLVFVDRAVVGLYANLRLVGARVDVGALLRARLDRPVPPPAA